MVVMIDVCTAKLHCTQFSFVVPFHRRFGFHKAEKFPVLHRCPVAKDFSCNFNAFEYLKYFCSWFKGSFLVDRFRSTRWNQHQNHFSSVRVPKKQTLSFSIVAKRGNITSQYTLKQQIAVPNFVVHKN